MLNSFEKTEAGENIHDKIEPFISPFKSLMTKDPWVLELGATLGYYYEGDWENARAQAAVFKKIHKNDRKLSEATELAKTFVRVG
jgi:hypothetical protein